MSDNAKVLAELLAMRAREEITAEQFEEAKRLAHFSTPAVETDFVAEKRTFFKENGAARDDDMQHLKLSSVPQPPLLREPSKAKDGLIGLIILALIVVIVVKCTSSAPNVQTQLRSRHILVTADRYGTGWPFPPFDDALLYCQVRSFGGVNRPMILVQLGATLYGLNGAAMGVGGYPRATDFFPRDDYGYKEDVSKIASQFIAQAMPICG